MDVVSEVMMLFGISATAAKHHVKNVANVGTVGGGTDPLPDPENKWVVMENLMMDYFPIKETPLSRRGKFAWWVAKACLMGEITLDTASSWLSAPVPSVTDLSLRNVTELW